MVVGVLIAGMLSVVQAGMQAADPALTAADPALRAIAAAVRAHVATTARVAERDVELRWLGLGAIVDCAETPQVLVDTRPGEDFRGRTELRVTLTSGGEQCGRLRLPARIAIWQDVQVAAADAAAGAAVKLKAGRAPRETMRGESIDPDAGTWLARHPLRAGETVSGHDVALAPTVRAGDPVVLQAIDGGLKVEAEAHMLNDGHIGERVRVANTATGTVVTGVLMDPRTVRVGGTP